MRFMHKVILVCPIMILLALSGCSEKTVGAKDYISWVTNKNNGLKVSKDIGNYSFCLQYEPVPYVALREQYDGKVTNGKLEEAIKERSGFQYFILEISTIDKKTDILKSDLKASGDYYTRIQYFSYMMQDDLKLMDGTQTVPCQLFQFERDYGVTPFQRFVLGFPKGKTSTGNQDKTLIYDDKVLGINKMEIKIDAKAIDRLPHLKLD